MSALRSLILPMAMLAAFAAPLAVASPERVMPLADLPHIHGIAFDPADSAKLLLATHNGLFRLDRGGIATQISQNTDDLMGFSLVPGSDRMLVSGHPVGGGNLGVHESTDGGFTWRQLSEGADGPVDFHAIAVSLGDLSIAYGLFAGGIQRSDDGGRTWAWTGRAPERTMDLAVSAREPDVLYAGTEAGVMTSTDGGRNWAPLGYAGIPATMVETGHDGSVYAYFVQSGLVRLDGQDWALLWAAPADVVLLHLAVAPDYAATLAAAGHDNRIYLSDDGGRTWRELVSDAR